MAITDEDRLEYSIFQGEDGDIRLHTKHMRTAAKWHTLATTIPSTPSNWSACAAARGVRSGVKIKRRKPGVRS